MSTDCTSRAQVPVESGKVFLESTTSYAAERSKGLKQLLAFLLYPPVMLLVIVTLVAGRGIARGEFFFYGDEMRHAMNGVFFRDFLMDLPLRHPVQYVYDYYAKYPALAFPHWPPLFHLIEGVFFLVLGLSPWVSRLVILCFALLAAYFWYRIAERFGPRYRAFLSAVILTCTPFILLYEQVTMLEIPALAACLGAVHFWLNFLETERRRDLWALVALVASAFLISQKAVFLPFLIGTDLILERRFRLLKRTDVWLGILAFLAAVFPWYLLALKTVNTLVSRITGDRFGYLTLGINYTFYLTALYHQLGPVLLGLACIGLVIALLRRTRVDRFLLVWLFSSYVCFVLISEKDSRHAMVWIPPLLYLALVALEALLVRRTWAMVASSGLALVFLVNGVRSERPIVSGAKEAAQYVLSLPESDIVYYQGALSGDFIFFVRKFDPEKRHLVAREKQVVVSVLGHDAREVLQTQEEVLDFFRTWGIRYAVIENVDNVPGLSQVRELLSSDKFELVRTFPVTTNQSYFPVRQILVFRYRGEVHRANQNVTIPMMTISRNITVDLSRLAGRPWPN